MSLDAFIQWFFLSLGLVIGRASDSWLAIIIVIPLIFGQFWLSDYLDAKRKRP